MLYSVYTLKSHLKHHVRTAFSLGGLFFQVSTRNSSTTSFLLRSPPSSAPREVPTPLVLVSSGKWDKFSQAGYVVIETCDSITQSLISTPFGSVCSMRALAANFAERGYTTLEIDIGLPKEEDRINSQDLMHHFEQGELTLPLVQIA